MWTFRKAVAITFNLIIDGKELNHSMFSAHGYTYQLELMFRLEQTTPLLSVQKSCTAEKKYSGTPSTKTKSGCNNPAGSSW